MAPTKDAPIVRFDPETGERRLEVAKWGLVPFFTKDLAKARKPINARSETVARSPLFKEAFARRRCLVPAAAYYEWRHDPSGKTPFAIARNDGEPVALGGMWEVWRSDGETLQTFATLTTDANPPLSLIQERMPVINRLVASSTNASSVHIPLRSSNQACSEPSICTSSPRHSRRRRG